MDERNKSRPAWLSRMAGPDELLSLLVLGTAVVALASPLAQVNWLPFVDYPQHLGTIAAIHGQGSPLFDRYFVVEYARTQYLLLYVLGDALAGPFGVEGAGRITAILSIASLPLAVASYLRAHGRPAILGALAAPIAMHAYVFWGFLNYAAGMALGIATLAAHMHLIRRPDAMRTGGFAIAAVLTFYAHAQLYAWMGLACVVQLAVLAPVIGRGRALRALGLSALGALPSIAATLFWLHQSGVIERGEAGGRSGHAAAVAAEGGGPSFAPVADTVRNWLSHSFDVYRDGSGVHVAVAFFFVASIVLMMRGFGDAAPSREEANLRSLAPEWVFVLTVALYLFGPFSYRLIEPISHRFLPLAIALVPVLGPRGPLSFRRALAIAPLLIALAITTAQVHASRFSETDREMGELDIALSRTEPGDRLLGLIFDPNSAVVPLPIYLHAHQYYQARVGGLACFSFVEFPKSPVQYAEGAAPPPFPPRFEWTPQRYDDSVWGEAFDYWLVRHEPGRDAPRSMFRHAAHAPELMYEGNRWSLFHRARPSDETR